MPYTSSHCCSRKKTSTSVGRLRQRWQKISSSWQKPQWLSVQQSVRATCLFVVTAPCITSTLWMIPQCWKLCSHSPMMFTRIPSQSLSEKTRKSIHHLLQSSVQQTHRLQPPDWAWQRSSISLLTWQPWQPCQPRCDKDSLHSEEV